MSLYDFAKPFLFRMEPERAHAVGMFFLRFLSQVETENESLNVRTSYGILKNPIGLAGGFDKTGKHLTSLQKLGFGFLVSGTITLDPWPGLPKPRIIRDVSKRALLNCLGFPNPGVDQFITNIKSQDIRVPVIASISGKTPSDILLCYEKVQPHVAAVELNLSSPNTASLKDLRQLDSFAPLVKSLATSKRKPTYLKVPPFYNTEQTARNLEMLRVWNALGFEGVTAGNAIPVEDGRLSVGKGGYSSPKLFKYTKEAVRVIKENISTNLEISSVGGISNANDVHELLSAGCKTVQLYSSLVYEGPRLIQTMLKELSEGNKKLLEIVPDES